MLSQPNGIILFDKPAGVTSFDVVAKVRNRLGGRKKIKVGHAGTLDPFATGLLILLIGQATKTQEQFMRLPKRYLTLAQLGQRSSTGDPEGEIIEGRMPAEKLELPIGQIMQRPPSFSAVKINGQRAYKLARRGEQFTIAEREITLYRFDELWREDDRAAFIIECSSGTYVRSLISDLTDAYCLELRRERIGCFDVKDADPEKIIPLEIAIQESTRDMSQAVGAV